MDLNENGIFEPGDGEQDLGIILDFLPDERLGVNDAGVTVFLAQGNPSGKGLYVSRLDLVVESPLPSYPKKIKMVGDTIQGSVLQDLSIYDPVANSNPPLAAFWGGIGGGDGRIFVTPIP